MPGGFLHRFDGGANIWKRDYHRSDSYYKGHQADIGTTTIFNNTFGADWLMSAAFLTATNTWAGVISCQLVLTTSIDVHVHDILALYVSPASSYGMTISFPMPLEVKDGYKVRIYINADGHAWGGICGAQETD